MTPQEIKKLETLGYIVEKKSPYHWHVKHPKSWIILNIWPTTKKMLQQGSDQSVTYRKLVKMVNWYFRGTKIEKEAKKQVEDMREGGLDYFLKKTK